MNKELEIELIKLEERLKGLLINPTPSNVVSAGYNYQGKNYIISAHRNHDGTITIKKNYT